MSEQGADETTYTYRPSLFGAPFVFRLADDGLHWDKGRRGGLVAYEAIRRIRMSYRPGTMQSQRFATELWCPDQPKLTIVSTSWKSMTEIGRGDAEYRNFVLALHRRLAGASRQPELVGGIHPVLFWLGIVVFAGTTFGMAALVVRAVQESAGIAALMIGTLAAIFLWQAGNFFRRNRPLRYSAASVPPLLLPRPARTTSTEHLA